MTGFAIAVSETTFVRAPVHGGLETSLDGGKSWRATLVERPTLGIRGLAVDGAGTIWATNSRVAWRSQDGSSWVQVDFPRTEPRDNGAVYAQLVTRQEGVWFVNANDGVLISPTYAGSQLSWTRLPVPGGRRLMGTAVAGGRFVTLVSAGQDVLSIDFTETTHRESLVRANAGGGLLSCSGTACAGLLGQDIVVRDAPDEAWRTVGHSIQLPKWVVANCRRGLGRIAEYVRNSSDDNFLYAMNGVAFDGTNIVISASISPDNNGYFPLSLIMGPGGLELVPYGHDGANVRRPGEFWFFEPGIQQVFVDPPE